MTHETKDPNVHSKRALFALKRALFTLIRTLFTLKRALGGIRWKRVPHLSVRAL